MKKRSESFKVLSKVILNFQNFPFFTFHVIITFCIATELIIYDQFDNDWFQLMIVFQSSIHIECTSLSMLVTTPNSIVVSFYVCLELQYMWLQLTNIFVIYTVCGFKKVWFIEIVFGTRSLFICTDNNNHNFKFWIYLFEIHG